MMYISHIERDTSTNSDLMSTTFQTNLTDTTYNGWANYETWNVALWIQNDEGLYNFAKTCGSYLQFVQEMKELWGATKTPDGVSYSDSNLNLCELADLMQEL